MRSLRWKPQNQESAVIGIVLSLLLAMHLLCVNVASGGPLVAAWLDWRGTTPLLQALPIPH
jgi:hypothetical protein